MTHEILIPFSGFYDSWHEHELDLALNDILRENPQLIERAYSKYAWSNICEYYSRKYTEVLSDKIEIPLQFKSLHSPKYYNFETDRIIATIDTDTLNRLVSETPLNELHGVCTEWFTSRDGFISHYKNDPTLWPVDKEEWDHNQLGALLAAWMRAQGVSEDLELGILEQMSEYGYMSESLMQDPNIYRLADVSYYLWERAVRAA